MVAQGAEIYLHFGQGQDLPALLIAVLVRSSLGVVTTVQGQGFAKGSVAYPACAAAIRATPPVIRVEPSYS